MYQSAAHARYIRMKVATPFLLLCLCALSGVPAAYAQRAFYVPMKYELVIAPISGNSLRAAHLANKPPTAPYSYQFTQGVRAKYRLNAWQAIRGSIGFHREFATSDYKGAGDQSSHLQSVLNGLDIRLGMDDMLYYRGRMQLYGGGDVVLRSMSSTTQRVGPLVDIWGTPTTAYTTYGVAGVLGLRYFISKNASISLENNILYQFAPEKAAKEGVAQRTWQTDILNASLSVHWVKMKKKCTCKKP
jgi:hypothetical protein